MSKLPAPRSERSISTSWKLLWLAWPALLGKKSTLTQSTPKAAWPSTVPRPYFTVGPPRRLTWVTRAMSILLASPGDDPRPSCRRRHVANAKGHRDETYDSRPPKAGAANPPCREHADGGNACNLRRRQRISSVGRAAS